MTTLNISMEKQYRTRDGREVRIYAVDAEATWAVHGAVRLESTHNWHLSCWTPEGLHRQVCDGPSDLDLIEVKPKITRTYWLTQYGHQMDGPMKAWAFDPRGHPDTHNIIAITGPHTIEFTEGDGL